MRGLTRSLLRLGAVGMLVVFVGCYTAQVRSAADAVEAARKAGKDKECPGDFDAAEQMVKRAKALCQTCQTKEANALAADAMAKINGLCPAKVGGRSAAPPPRAPSPTRLVVRVSVLGRSGWLLDSDVVDLERDQRVDRQRRGQRRLERLTAGLPGQHDDVHADRQRSRRLAHELGDREHHGQGRAAEADGQAHDPRQLRPRQVGYPPGRRRGSAEGRGVRQEVLRLQDRDRWAHRLDRQTRVQPEPSPRGEPLRSRSGFSITARPRPTRSRARDSARPQPTADNKTAKGRAENRRAEILVFCE